MSPRQSLGTCVVAVVLAMGCGDDSEPGESSAGAAGMASGGTAGGALGGASGTSGSAGAPAGGSGGGGGGAGDGGAGGSAGSAAGGLAGTSGSGGGSPTGSVACGSSSCALPATFCCALYNQPDQCMSAGELCFYGVDVACDGPEDCPGQICCGKLAIKGQNKSYESMSCEATCTGTDRREICGASGSCASGKSCGTSDLLPQYRDCK
jgi:hypothetical protein